MRPARAAVLCLLVGCGGKADGSRGPANTDAQAPDANPASEWGSAPASDSDAAPPPCIQPLTRLVSGRASIWGAQLAADGAYVYWTEFASIVPEYDAGGVRAVWRVSVHGGAPERIAVSNVGDFGVGMEVYGGEVFWSQGLDSLDSTGIFTVSVAGGPVTQLGDMGNACAPYGGLAADARAVYAATIPCSVGNGILDSVAGGPPVTLFSSSTTALSWLTVTDGSIVMSTTAGLLTIPESGGATTTLAGTTGATHAVYDGNVYFADDGRVFAVPLTGGTPKALGTLQASLGAGALAVDESGIYYFTPMILARMPLAGGDPVALATTNTRTGSGTSSPVVLDATGIMWFGESGTIMRLGKCAQ